MTGAVGEKNQGLGGISNESAVTSPSVTSSESSLEEKVNRLGPGILKSSAEPINKAPLDGHEVTRLDGFLTELPENDQGAQSPNDSECALDELPPEASSGEALVEGSATSGIEFFTLPSTNPLASLYNPLLAQAPNDSKSVFGKQLALKELLDCEFGKTIHEQQAKKALEQEYSQFFATDTFVIYKRNGIGAHIGRGEDLKKDLHFFEVQSNNSREAKILLHESFTKGKIISISKNEVSKIKKKAKQDAANYIFEMKKVLRNDKKQNQSGFGEGQKGDVRKSATLQRPIEESSDFLFDDEDTEDLFVEENNGKEKRAEELSFERNMHLKAGDDEKRFLKKQERELKQKDEINYREEVRQDERVRAGIATGPQNLNAPKKS